MDNRLWTRTLLACYCRLPRAMSNADKTFEAKVWECFKGGSDAVNELTRLTGIIVRKKSFELAKAVVDEVLAAFETDRFTILRQRYLESMTFRQVSETTATSIRTVFRKHNAELDRFAKELEKRGYDNDCCEKEWGRIPLFLREKQVQKHGDVAADGPHVSVYLGEAFEPRRIKSRIVDKPSVRY